MFFIAFFCHLITFGKKSYYLQPSTHCLFSLVYVGLWLGLSVRRLLATTKNDTDLKFDTHTPLDHIQGPHSPGKTWKYLETWENLEKTTFSIQNLENGGLGPVTER